jgi:hypothetical protein
MEEHRRGKWRISRDTKRIRMNLGEERIAEVYRALDAAI